MESKLLTTSLEDTARGGSYFIASMLILWLCEQMLRSQSQTLDSWAEGLDRLVDDLPGDGSLAAFWMMSR